MIASIRPVKEVIFFSERSLSPEYKPSDTKKARNAEAYSASNWFGRIKSVSCSRFLYAGTTSSLTYMCP